MFNHLKNKTYLSLDLYASIALNLQCRKTAVMNT